MKRITFTADANLIKRARIVARAQNTTLSQAFREWLTHYTDGAERGKRFDELMKRLQHVRAGRQFTRAEMNHRS